MAVSFSDLTPEGKRYFAELNKLLKLEVQVGFQEDSGAYEDGTTLAQVAAYNEYGGSDQPARPFMKQSFENHEDKLQKFCDQANQIINKGGTAQAALQRLGVNVRGLVQEEIVSGGFAANAESTIRKKGSATPLIDTSFMRQSVNYKIKPR